MLGWRTVRMAIGLAGMVLIIPPGVTLMRSWATVNKTVALTDLQELEWRTQVHFPPGSRLVEGERFNALNTFIYARVELPSRDSAKAFVAQPRFDGAMDRTNILVDELPDDPALLQRWQLSRIKHPLSAQGGRLNDPGGSPVSVVIDLDHPTNPVLFLHFYD